MTVLLVLFGSLGDFGGYRKKGLKLGWFLFSAAPLVAGLVSPGDVNGDDTNSMKFALFIAALLFVVTNISRLAAQQMFDAYLPLLAQTHPKVQQTLGMIPVDDDGGTWCYRDRFGDFGVQRIRRGVHINRFFLRHSRKENRKTVKSSI